MTSMNWATLLNEERLNRPDALKQDGRTQFQQDIDRIVFSSAFRRLAHKTQVHPLADNDHTHTRLTHSVEVSSVGRSLGTIVGQSIAGKAGIPGLTADSFGYVIQAACLAHDIGNPPFGHSGEDSIGEWFKEAFLSNEFLRTSLSDTQRHDLKFFEGNAQGLRILTQLENARWNGGLQLTHAALGTFSKYPHSSAVHPIPGDQYVGSKKIGFFESERNYFLTVAEKCGLMKREQAEHTWHRHPLAFLVEAADDICYAIIDIEDGYELNYLSLNEAKDILEPIAGNIGDVSKMEETEVVGKLRAIAIGKLIEEVAAAFLTHETALLSGKFSDELIARTIFKDNIKQAKTVARKKIYWSERKTKIEIAGSVIISGLLDCFVPVAIELAKKNWDAEKLSEKQQKYYRLVPAGFSGVTSLYDAILRTTDFISGMTDRYALDLYRKLKGISI